MIETLTPNVPLWTVIVGLLIGIAVERGIRLFVRPGPLLGTLLGPLPVAIGFGSPVWYLHTMESAMWWMTIVYVLYGWMIFASYWSQ